MRTKRVIVKEYDPEWINAFDSLRRRIEAALAKVEFTCQVHHVGSTSVPGLAAKPIIDIDIEIPDMTRFEEAAALLEKAGYRREGDLGIPLREAFAYEGQEARPAHHLYICPSGGAELRRHLAFRDWLIAHPQDALAYGETKKRAASDHPWDIDGYIQDKSDIVRRIYARAGIDLVN